MDLVVKNKIIDTPLKIILETVRKELNNGKLKDIKDEYQDNIAITCPSHKNGYEQNPSCQVYTRRDNEDIEYGKCHCFTCGFTASLPQLISFCFKEDPEFGEEWLSERFGTSFRENYLHLPEIDLNHTSFSKPLNEKVLNNLRYYHPYMWQRKLSKEIVDKFQIGYDPNKEMISFPVWDDQGRLVMVTYRSVKDKRFYIDKDADKPVYLLNFIKAENISRVYVCESQINALTLWSWGYPAIALFGTGSKHQYEILNKSPIREYILCFDGDEAGDKGKDRFFKNIRKDVFVSYIKIPRGKDINDLEKEDFQKLFIYN